MRNVHLLGEIGDKFGHNWEADCITIADIFKLIECQTIGFRQYLIDCAEEGTNFAIRIGKDLNITAEELTLNIPGDDVYISAIPAGSAGQSSGVAQIVVAAILTAIAIYFPPAAPYTAELYALAISLAVQGVSLMLMPDVQKDKSKEGYFFNGPVNTVKQGQPVPLLYGELIVGGAPISVTFTKRKISSAGFIFNSANTVHGDFDAVSNLNPEDLGVA